MWGIIPAAGMGSRIQPLAFSKELLPIGSAVSGGEERPRAVSEYLIERMIQGGVDKICFVISPGKSDIVNYFGGHASSATVFYAVQPRPAGLCNALFRAAPLIAAHEQVYIGLPDTIWFPRTALSGLPDHRFTLLLFPVPHPERFDAVTTDENGDVLAVQVKHPSPASNYVWGAMKMPGSVLHELHRLWMNRGDEYLGTLLNEYMSQGGKVAAVKSGDAYVDVGTLGGYREALRLVDAHSALASSV